MTVNNSILDSTKLSLGLTVDYTPFDPKIIMWINGVFSDLNMLGVGPEQGFDIQDNTPVWSAFLGDDKRLNNIKNYMYLRVRLLFDPPTVGYHIEAAQKQIEKLEFLINVQRESVAWVDPDPNVNVTILDGGGA